MVIKIDSMKATRIITFDLKILEFIQFRSRTVRSHLTGESRNTQALT